MKTLLSILMMIGVLCSIGCRPVEKPAPVPEIVYGKASCDFDGNKWYGVVEPVHTYGFARNYVRILKNTTGQNIRFSNVNFELGKYQISDSIQMEFNPYIVDVSYFSGFTSGVVEFYYQPLRLDSIENYFEITSLDENTLKGNFQCVFAKMRVVQIDTLPVIPVDTIFMLNGKFSTPFTE